MSSVSSFRGAIRSDSTELEFNNASFDSETGQQSFPLILESAGNVAAERPELLALSLDEWHNSGILPGFDLFLLDALLQVAELLDLCAGSLGGQGMLRGQSIALGYEFPPAGHQLHPTFDQVRVVPAPDHLLLLEIIEMGEKLLQMLSSDPSTGNLLFCEVDVPFDALNFESIRDERLHERLLGMQIDFELFSDNPDFRIEITQFVYRDSHILPRLLPELILLLLDGLYVLLNDFRHLLLSLLHDLFFLFDFFEQPPAHQFHLPNPPAELREIMRPQSVQEFRLPGLGHLSGLCILGWTREVTKHQPDPFRTAPGFECIGSLGRNLSDDIGQIDQLLQGNNILPTGHLLSQQLFTSWENQRRGAGGCPFQHFLPQLSLRMLAESDGVSVLEGGMRPTSSRQGLLILSLQSGQGQQFPLQASLQ
jgi:hypothetical protein